MLRLIVGITKVNLPKQIEDILNKTNRTWDDFGITWEWAIKQEWWFKFTGYIIEKVTFYPIPKYEEHLLGLRIPTNYINPDCFSEAIYNFLKEKEK